MNKISKPINMLIRYFLWLLFIGLQLAIGIIIYLQSGKDLVGFVWFEQQLPAQSHWLSSLVSKLPELYQKGWIADHLPDILWSSACASLLVGIWVSQLTVSKLLLLGLGCAIFYETLQGLSFTGGTFDWLDMMYSLLSGALSTFITYLLLKMPRNGS
ncbi:hypothetical protein [Kangiella sp. M94]